MKQNYLAAFDFDGVIWDSVNECFHIGYKVFNKMEGEISGSLPHLREKFRQGRYLAKTGNDFFITFYMMKQNPDIDFERVTYQEYYRYRDEMSRKLEEFAKKFYSLRRDLQENHREEWLSMQGPFENIMEQLPVIDESFSQLAICSTKDKASIKLLLSGYGREYPVYGREDSTHKAQQIEQLSKDTGIPPERIIFVDDLVENLNHVKKAGCIGVLAGWGYNNPNVWKEAREYGFPLISKDNITKQLFDIINSLKQARC